MQHTESAVPELCVDERGYPTHAFLSWLKHTRDADTALRLAAQYFETCGFGATQLEGQRVTLITGGWSGCEEVIGHIMENLYVAQAWMEHHRGGKWVFELPEVSP